MKRHVSILGIRGIPARHGGFETFAEQLSIYLERQGWLVSVYCQEDGKGKVSIESWRGIELVHVPVGARGAAGTILFDLRSFWHAFRRGSRNWLVLGYGTGGLAILARLLGVRQVTNMDGFEWKREKWSIGAKVWLWINEYCAGSASRLLIADHPVIYDYLLRKYRRTDCKMIPYGGCIPDSDPSCLAELGLADSSFCTLIARPEPENSILEIVTAYSARRRNVYLVVLGHYDTGNSYHKAVLQAASDEVIFLGAVYDSRAVGALRRASLVYFHGHTVGGTNPSLVEALAAGNPVIARDNQFNRWVAGEGGLYFSDIGECDAAICRVLEEEGLRCKLAANAENRFRSDFGWLEVLSSYHTALTRAYLR